MTKTFCDWCEVEITSTSNECGRMKSILNVSGHWCEACVRAAFEFMEQRKPKREQKPVPSLCTPGEIELVDDPEHLRFRRVDE